MPPDTMLPHAAPPVPVWSRDVTLVPGADLWVFGYGSLMWNPGFPFVTQARAMLYGYHRRFCIASFRYRGTPERPGLVLGLDAGGCCRGIAFQVAAERVPAVMDYLWEREMFTRAYRPRMLTLRLEGAAERRVSACAFVVDRQHGQYCGCLDDAAMAHRIAECVGERGPNMDYLANTVEHLERLGIHDRRLSKLLAAVRRLTGGSGIPA